MKVGGASRPYDVLAVRHHRTPLLDGDNCLLGRLLLLCLPNLTTKLAANALTLGILAVLKETVKTVLHGCDRLLRQFASLRRLLLVAVIGFEPT